MPHFIVEYTANLGPAADIAGFLRKANQVLIGQGDVYPTGGIRSRAIACHEFAIADGSADDAFVHATLKIGMGRTDAEKKATGDALFTMMKEHFAQLIAARYLALSLEVAEFSEAGTWKQNNIHTRFRKELQS